MCHEWWPRRKGEECEAGRQLWGEFEHTEPLSDPDVRDEQPEVTLEKQEPIRVAAEH